jgi:hypothetical protein
MDEDIVRYLEARVEQLRNDLATLEDDRKTLDDRMKEVAELYEATNAVLKAELTRRGLSDDEEESWATVKPRLRTMSLKDAIRTIVRLKGDEGIHVDKILESLRDAGFPLKARDPKTSIASTIYLETQSKGTYEKVAPNTFRLAGSRDN